MTDTHRAGPAARRLATGAVIALAAGGTLAVAFLPRWLAGVRDAQSVLMAFAALTATLVVSLLVLSYTMWRFADRVQDSLRFPPPDAALLRDTLVVAGERALRIVPVLRVVTVAMLLAGVALAVLSARIVALLDHRIRSTGELALAEEVMQACDVAAAIAVSTPGAAVSRENGVVVDAELPQTSSGCRIEVEGSFARSEGRDAAVRLREGLAARGWTEHDGRSADGPDGTAFALGSPRAGCLVRGRWDGGDDAGEPAPVADDYAVTVLCCRELARGR